MSTIDIHDVIKEKFDGTPLVFKVRKGRETEPLFNDTFRSVLNVTVFDCFKFKRIRCLTKNSSFIYLPVDYPDPVMYTSIENEQCVLSRCRLKAKKSLWLAVTRKFVHNKSHYDIGDIFEIKRARLFRRIRRWLGQNSAKNELSNVDVYLYPSKKSTRIPVEFLESHCKFCDSPYLRGYRLLSSMQFEQTPVILTIPFDPFKRTILTYESSDPKSTTSYFEKVLVDGIENYDAIITTNSNDNYLKAITIPESVLFDVEVLDDCYKSNVIVKESEIHSAKHSTISQIINMENIHETIEQLNLWETNNTKDEEFSFKPRNNNEEEIISEIEMQYSVKYKTQKINRKSKSPRNPSSNEDELNCSDDEENSTSEEEVKDVEESDFVLVGPKTKNEYLLPLTEFTREYSLFKSEKSHSCKADTLPDDIVIGPDGYVKVKEEEEKKKKKKRDKLFFWKQSQHPENKSEEMKNLQEAMQSNEPIKIEYYQPSFNIHQEKPPLPKKPETPEKSHVPLIRPQVPRRSKSVLQYKHNSLSARPLLLSSSSYDDEIEEIETSIPVNLNKNININPSNKEYDENQAEMQNIQNLNASYSQTESQKSKVAKDHVKTSFKKDECLPKKNKETVLKSKPLIHKRPMSQSLTPLLHSPSFEENEEYAEEKSFRRNDSVISSRVSYFETKISSFK